MKIKGVVTTEEGVCDPTPAAELTQTSSDNTELFPSQTKNHVDVTVFGAGGGEAGWWWWGARPSAEHAGVVVIGQGYFPPPQGGRLEDEGNKKKQKKHKGWWFRIPATQREAEHPISITPTKAAADVRQTEARRQQRPAGGDLLLSAAGSPGWFA